MKAKIWQDKPYSKLIRKIFVQTVILVLLAFLVVMLIRSMGHGLIGNYITRLYAMFFDISWDAAAILYYRTVRKYLDYFIFGSMVVFFLLFFRLLLSWFTKNFDQIIAGVDKLADGTNEPVVLSADLGFMAIKLNQVKAELERGVQAQRLAEKRKNDLVMYLAHDIKTPLTSVLGYLSLLAEASDMPDTQRAKYINISLDKACRLESLINEFFEITRYNSPQVPINKTPIDLYYMLAQMADEFYPLLSARGNRAVLEVHEDLIIPGDSGKLARVFNNLLKNAAAYSYPDTDIIIKATVEGDYGVISLQNQGETIPPHKLEALFDKFYRLNEARTSNTGGSGLGLSIAKEIVALHGGLINAYSENETVTFVVMLPIKS